MPNDDEPEFVELLDEAKSILYAARRRLSQDSAHYPRIGAVIAILDDIVE